MRIREEVRSAEFIAKNGKGVLDAQTLLSILEETASQMLVHEPEHKYRNLLYPKKPREIEARKILCDILDARGFNYMIECPIYSPAQKIRGRTSFVDLSIYLKAGIVDVEFKQARSGIMRDFFKLLSPDSIGCASFYLFNNENIHRQLSLIKQGFQEAYRSASSLTSDISPRFDKWYVMCLVALKERRVFSAVFETLNNLDLSRLTERL